VTTSTRTAAPTFDLRAPARGPLPTPTDPAGRMVQTALGPVHVVVEGDGPTAVLVHGLPGSTRDWRYLGPVLAARGVRAVRVDLPGFGDTPLSTAKGARVVDVAAVIHAVVDALRLDRFALVGHSFGGAIAMKTAARMQPHVAALALVNAPGPLRHRGYMLPSSLHQATAALLASPYVGERWAPVVHKAFVGAGFTKGVPADAPSLAFLAGLIASLDFRGMRRDLRAVACPVLVASAEDDPLVEPFVARATIASLPATVVRSHLHVQHGGHYLQKHEACAIGAWIADRLLPCAPPQRQVG
jgi:pimeloyl-ACP methyl ester carboxylesterase